MTVHSTLNQDAFEKYVRNLGWRVYVCNDHALSIEEAVLAYRQDYLIEHGFARYKGKVLGLTPIYLSSTTRIKGLIRLLSIGLRILCLLEFSVRETLQQKQEKTLLRVKMKRWNVAEMLEIGKKLFAKIHKQKKHAHHNHELHFMAREINDWLPQGIQSIMDGNYNPRCLKRYYFSD
jgi:transposase